MPRRRARLVATAEEEEEEIIEPPPPPTSEPMAEAAIVEQTEAAAPVWDYLLLEDVAPEKKEELKNDWKEMLTSFLRSLGALLINLVSLRFRSFVSQIAGKKE